MGGRKWRDGALLTFSSYFFLIFKEVVVMLYEDEYLWRGVKWYKNFLDENDSVQIRLVKGKREKYVMGMFVNPCDGEHYEANRWVSVDNSYARNFLRRIGKMRRRSPYFGWKGEADRAKMHCEFDSVCWMLESIEELVEKGDWKAGKEMALLASDELAMLESGEKEDELVTFSG